MSLVFAGICSHAPGITGRAHLADPALKDALHAELFALGEAARLWAFDITAPGEVRREGWPSPHGGSAPHPAATTSASIRWRSTRSATSASPH